MGSASARVAKTETARITKDVSASGLADDADAWLKAAGDAVLSKLEDGPLTAQQLRELVPEIAGTVRVGSPGAKWGGDIPIAPRVLGQLGARGAPHHEQPPARPSRAVRDRRALHAVTSTQVGHRRCAVAGGKEQDDRAREQAEDHDADADEEHDATATQFRPLCGRFRGSGPYDV